MTIDRFSPGVAERIGYYVYRLIDPRNGETFYVGKGKGDRVFSHANNAPGFLNEANKEDEDVTSLKVGRINRIKSAGLDVIHVIHRHELSEKVALEVEAALMDAYPGLSNAQGGHGSDTRGVMAADQINDKYALPELDDCKDVKLILINIAWLDTDQGGTDIHDEVRCAWRISPSRARHADYVLAVSRGIVKGVFVPHDWKEATTANFPQLRFDLPGRWGFIGEEADATARARFVGDRGKRISAEGMKHTRNPVRYWNID